MDFEKYKKEFEPLVEDAKYIYEEWKKDWHNWSNNKRKRHGYPMRRKPNNITRSFWYQYQIKQLLFKKLEDVIDRCLIDNSTNDKWFAKFIDCRNILKGEPNTFNAVNFPQDRDNIYVIPTPPPFKPVKFVFVGDKNV